MKNPRARKDKEYEKLRTKMICISIWLKKLNQTYIGLLDVDSVARDSWSPPPVHGWEGMFHGWGPYPWIYPQVAFSIFKTPQAFISLLSVALVPFINTIGPPHLWIFHLIRGLSTNNRIDEYMQRSMDGDYPRVTCNTLILFVSVWCPLILSNRW